MKCLAILMLCALSCAGHKITELLVPLIADPRRAAELSCHFSMDDQRLHSVKWYRDMHEIFRYNPQQKPPIHLFNVTGIMVQSGDCATPEDSGKGTGDGWCVVRVMPPPAASRAAYTCEVSTEGPKFQIARQAKHMTVVALPDSPPLISGAPRQARAGEQLILNCSTDYSLPPQDINWYIDGVLQKEEAWDHTSLSAALAGGLRASWRVLRTRVSASGLRAQCEAVLHALDPPVVKRSPEAVVTVHSSTQLEKYTSNDGMAMARWPTFLVLISFYWIVEGILCFKL